MTSPQKLQILVDGAKEDLGEILSFTVSEVGVNITNFGARMDFIDYVQKMKERFEGPANIKQLEVTLSEQDLLDTSIISDRAMYLFTELLEFFPNLTKAVLMVDFDFHSKIGPICESQGKNMYKEVRKRLATVEVIFRLETIKDLTLVNEFSGTPVILDYFRFVINENNERCNYDTLHYICVQEYHIPIEKLFIELTPQGLLMAQRKLVSCSLDTKRDIDDIAGCLANVVTPIVEKVLILGKSDWFEPSEWAHIWPNATITMID